MSNTIGVSIVPGQTAFNTDAASDVFERNAARQADHAVLGAMTGGDPGPADDVADRGTIDDGAAALLAYPG
jgi:hypothetical protein